MVIEHNMEDPSGEPTNVELTDLSKKLIYRWQRLGPRLGVNQDYINVILRNHVERQLLQLDNWITGFRPWDGICQIWVFTCSECQICVHIYCSPCKMLADNSIQKTPTKVIKPDDLCRVCRCSPAVLGRGKCNLFTSKKSIEEKIAERLSTVLDIPVLQSDGFFSVICYKCHRQPNQGFLRIKWNFNTLTWFICVSYLTDRVLGRFQRDLPRGW